MDASANSALNNPMFNSPVYPNRAEDPFPVSRVRNLIHPCPNRDCEEPMTPHALASLTSQVVVLSFVPVGGSAGCQRSLIFTALLSSSQLLTTPILSTQTLIHTSPMDYYYTLSSTVSSAAASTRPQEVVIDIVDYEGGSTGGQGYCTIA
ncbi:hypothetical protein FS837_000616 [Tulasnella sp. UAMH 9824]|nr:hypothetical protein FS837_000616 [Tulasnella sp. UAMH 9824]